MRVGALAVLILLLAACVAPGGPTGRSSPRPTRSGATPGSPLPAVSFSPGAPPSPTPSPAASPPAASPSPAALACRLAVASAGNPNGPPGGFVTFPGGSFTPDPNSAVAFDAATGRTHTVQAPVLWGDSSGLTYDRGTGRWLPVARAQVAFDGSTYAYTREASPSQSLNEIHLVRVSNGSDSVLYNQNAFDALDLEREGVYAVYHVQGTDGSRGLWLIDAGTGAIKFSAGGPASFNLIDGGGAWTFSLDGNRFGSSAVARLDLSSSVMTTWFDPGSPSQPPAPGSRVSHVVGFDGGHHPLVVVFTNGGGLAPETWLVTAPGSASRVSGLTLTDAVPAAGVTDSHGTWVTGSDGIYLYTGGSFTKMAPPPFSQPYYQIAGGCD